MGKLEARLAAECIQSIWCIDDENAAPPSNDIGQIAYRLVSLGEVGLASLGNLSPDIFEIVSAALKIDPIDRTDRLAQSLMAFVSSKEVGAEFFSALLSQLPDETQKEIGLSSQLAGIFSNSDAEFKSISFTDWYDTAPNILGSATPESRVLLLIDRTNDAEAIEIDGIDILTALFVNYSEKCDNIDCIVVTSSAEPDQELVASHEIFCEVRDRVNGLGGKRVRKVFVLSKARLSQDEGNLKDQLLIHLDRLKASRLTHQLATESRTVLEEGIRDATDWLADVSLPEFHWAIFRSSQEEGTSEIQTLLRLVALKQSIRLETQFRHNKNIVDAIVGLRDIPRESVSHTAFPSELEALRRLEFEREGNYVNQLRLPIVSGDVFCFTTPDSVSPKKSIEAILLGNPCDLTLRKDGKREAKIGLLIPIERRIKSNAPLAQTGELAIVFATGDRAGDTEYIIRPNKVIAVPLSILDLVWLNDDGAASLSSDKATWASDLLSQSQTKAANRWKPKDEKRYPAIEVFGITAEPARKTQAKPQIGDVHQLKYELRRSWRLTHEYAAAALLAFAQTISRPAFGHDFVRGWVVQTNGPDPT